MSEPLVVPIARLSAEALRGVIEEFITREGTDYGHREMAFEDKVRQVRGQLERGDVVIVFDPEGETVNLVLARDLPR